MLTLTPDPLNKTGFIPVQPLVAQSANDTQPLEIPKDNFLAQVAHLTLDPHRCLPTLDKTSVARLLEILTQSRLLTGKNGAFEIKFTLAELFTFLLAKGEGTDAIEQIELAGEGVPWVLNEYVCSALSPQGIVVPPALLQDFARIPHTIEFRIFILYGSHHDILLVRDRIVDFFIQKTDPSFRNAILKKGFSKSTQPEGADLMSTAVFHDALANCGINIVIYHDMQRECLFVQDDLRLVMTPHFIQSLPKAAAIPVNLISSSSSCQAIIDRLTGIVRGEDIPNIDCDGWAALLIRFIKGDRGFSSAFEKALLDKIHASLVDNRAKTMAVAAASWLEKALDYYVGKDSAAALTLTLQACLSLKKHGYEDSVDHCGL